MAAEGAILRRMKVHLQIESRQAKIENLAEQSKDCRYWENTDSFWMFVEQQQGQAKWWQQKDWRMERKILDNYQY